MSRCRSGVALPHAAISASVRPQPRHTPASTVQTPVQGEGTVGSIVVGIDGWTFESWRGLFYPARGPGSQRLAEANRQEISIDRQPRCYAFGELPLQLPVSAARPLDFTFYNCEGGKRHIPDSARLLIRQTA